MAPDPDSAESPVTGLTDAQRSVLRLVDRTRTSKLIALQLGLSPHTVDDHCKAAVRALGVSNRFEAAERLRRAETPANPQSENGRPQTLGMAENGASASDHASPLNDDRSRSDLRLEERSNAFDLPPASDPTFPWPVRTRQRPENNLSAGELVAATAALTTAITMSAIATVYVVLQLMSFLEAILTRQSV